VKGKGWIGKVEGFARRARGVWLWHFLNSESELTLHALPFAFHPAPLFFTLYPLPFTLHYLPLAIYHSAGRLSLP
jgi:hypothetical protein